MVTILEGTGLAHDEGADKRQVTVGVSLLALEALAGDGANDSAPAKVESALRCYLGDSGMDRPAWPYPGFLRGSETRRDRQVAFEVEEGLWREFAEEAEKQGVTVEQLVEHAAFYFAAELDAGRVTQRILDDLRSGGKAAGS